MKYDGVWFEDHPWKERFKLVYEDGEYQKIHASGKLGFQWSWKEVEGLIRVGTWVPAKQELIKNFIKENL